MDFAICVLRNFEYLDYKEPVGIKNKNDILFYLMYKEPSLFNVSMSYNYLQRLGQDRVYHLVNNFICYKQNVKSVSDTNIRRVITNNLYIQAQLFSNALWFVKDNAVTPYFSTVSSDSPIEPEYLQRSIYYTNSSGSYDISSFSNDEIEEAMKIYSILESFTIKMKRENIDLSKDLVNMSDYLRFDTPSFVRGFYYLGTARNIDFLPAKIASYISILESLFAVKGENTHKTAERTSFFIGNNTDDRIKIYQDIVSAYNIRSMYVHGSEIKTNTFELLPNASKNLDSLVRRVLKEMFLNHQDLNYKNKRDKNDPNSKNADDIDKWFNELILRKD